MKRSFRNRGEIRSTYSHHATTGQLLLHMLGYWDLVMQLQLEAWIGARAFWVQSSPPGKKKGQEHRRTVVVCAELLKKKQVQNSYWNGGWI